MDNYKPSFYPMFIVAIFVVMVIWWIFINANGLVGTSQNFYFGALLGVLPIAGSIFGFLNARKWGNFKSAIGQAIWLISLGLLTWGIGTLIFAYYNIVLQVEVPYPSIADSAYILSWPLWIFGMIRLSKATGAKYGLRLSGGKLILLAVPALVVLISYYLLVFVAREGVIVFTDVEKYKLFFDLAYPLGDVVILTVALLIYGLSFKYLGGIYKKSIYMILASFVLMYFADFAFSYTTTVDTFYTANWVDLLFTVTFFTLSVGVALMHHNEIEKNNGPNP